VLQMGIDEFGPEDLMSIQYQGRGIQYKEPDRYMPHCDGECKVKPHRRGGRMATIDLYCTAPHIGGATNFRKSGLHVVGAEGRVGDGFSIYQSGDDADGVWGYGV